MSRTPMAEQVQVAADALARVARMAEKGLPEEPGACILTGAPGENDDDCTTHGHEGEEIRTILPGYPFDVSLDEIVATFQAWADRMHDAGL